MLAHVLDKISNWFETAERRRRDEYLAMSTDVVDLEQRMRSLESDGYSR